MTNDKAAALRALAGQLQAMAETDHFPLEKWCRVNTLYRANTQPAAVLALLDEIARMREALGRIARADDHVPACELRIVARHHLEPSA